MTGLKILALSPIGITALATATPSSNAGLLQFGALGLCAIIVIFLCGFIKQLIDKIDKKDQVMGRMFERNTNAYNRLANLLEDRPCLNKDHRIKGEAVEQGNNI